MALTLDYTRVTSSITDPVSLPGAPYHPGDPIAFEHKGAWHEGMVYAIALLPEQHVRFGVRWAVRVDWDDTCTIVGVDDDGLNHTRTQRVRGSHRIVA
jgi:hypothetical protein